MYNMYSIIIAIVLYLQGWGCGYRTLQTICSWFISNESIANNEKIVPTINKIQRIIDEVGDKTSIFVESKNWIGTFEVSLIHLSIVRDNR